MSGLGQSTKSRACGKFVTSALREIPAQFVHAISSPIQFLHLLNPVTNKESILVTKEKYVDARWMGVHISE